MNQGRLCARALAMTQYVDHPDRLRYPVKRTGKRGEGKWLRINWAEAFDLIEEKMNTIRWEREQESMVFNVGTGLDIYAWICMLAYAYGSPNVMFGLSGQACYGPRLSAVITVQGDFAVFDAAQWFPDRYDRSEIHAPGVHDYLGLQHPCHMPGQPVRPLDRRSHEKRNQDHLH